MHPISTENAQQIEVVGERFYRAAMQRIVGTPPLNMAVIQPVPVMLKREPTHAVDPLAISVIIQEEVVGYLSAADAAHFGPELARVEAAGAVALVQGTLWCKTTDEGLMSNVRIKIPHDWVFDGSIDDAEYVRVTPRIGPPRSFRGAWLLVFAVVAIWLVIAPYPLNLVFALLNFLLGAFIVGILRFAEKIRMNC